MLCSFDDVSALANERQVEAAHGSVALNFAARQCALEIPLGVFLRLIYLLYVTTFREIV